MEFVALRKKLIEDTKKQIARSVTPDLLLIQSISSIEELDRALNMLTKRLREWFGMVNPELERSITDHEALADIILKGKAKKEASSMGADLDDVSMAPLLLLAQQIKNMYDLRKEEQAYIEALMIAEYPNLQAVAGTMIGAKLISLAGNMHRLMLFPSSTVQLLGAEKSFFKHLRNKMNKSPKYGVIFNHPFISKADKAKKGKAARELANKITICCKLDYFKGEFLGDKILAELEKKVL